MGNITTIEQTRAITTRRAKKAAGEIHASGVAEQIAERVKDETALRGALVRKLEAQRDFAGQYRAMYPKGGDKKSDEYLSASSGALIEATDWCLSFGFALRTVQRWCELLEEHKFTARQEEIIKRCLELAAMWQAANFSSASNEWYTPANYIEAVRETLGRIDLDPASSSKANRIIRAGKIFTQTDDGLARDWFGCVFLNPPYGVINKQSVAALFCNKAIEQYIAGNVEAAIVLVNSLHSQKWQKPLYDFPICFVNERISFVSADGQENENPTFQNIFVYLGLNVEKFARTFAPLGYVMRKVELGQCPMPNITEQN